MSEAEPLQPKYKRVLLKLSGEAFCHHGQFGISIDETLTIARQIERVARKGVEIAVVIGGGNLMRGAHFSANNTIIKESTADYMGMLATVMNGMALHDALDHIKVPVRLMTAVPMPKISEEFTRLRALRHFEQKRVVILAAGTGNPHFTTDTAAALRGRELECDVVLKATRVEGVYSADPEKNPHAHFYKTLTFKQALDNNLKVMDATAFSVCREAYLPIIVFNYKKEGNIERVIAGEQIGTLVTNE